MVTGCDKTNHRRWEALLIEYRRVVRQESAADGSLPVELFEAIQICVNDKGKSGGGSEVAVAVAEAAAEKSEQLVMESESDFDLEAQGNVAKLFSKTGSKKQSRRMKRKKRVLQTISPWGYSTNPKTNNDEESSSANEKVTNKENIAESLPEQGNIETQEEIMAHMLYENALQLTRYSKET
ncbi:hypothetical protein CASFOL_038384 [Castilleja foliolosa]|uniref:Uncharacterized protein n=1 Tax=Castilleja foliolosa TaxID=1961234 RepID=A0ABD3BLI0_9LAMI